MKMQVVPASLVERGLPSAEFSCRGHELPPAVIWPPTQRWPPQPRYPMLATLVLLPSTTLTISTRKAWEIMPQASVLAVVKTIAGGRQACLGTLRGEVDPSLCQISSNKLIQLYPLLRHEDIS